MGVGVHRDPVQPSFSIILLFVVVIGPPRTETNNSE